MKRLFKSTIFTVAFILTIGFISTGVQAEEDKQAAAKADKTGTNPINFQREIRLYNEFSWLNAAGDGHQNLTTVEFRTPFLEGKWQWRIRARYNLIEADFNNDGIDEVDDSGFGDMDMRFLWICGSSRFPI
jgi:hypothetical protein